MNVTPPSPTTPTEVDTLLLINDTPPSLEVVTEPENPTTTKAQRRMRPRWERRLPRSFRVATVANITNSLILQVQIESADRRERPIKALVDSGATGTFIDKEYVISNSIPTRKLISPILVFNVDGSPNEAGSITEVAELRLTYKDHSETTLFAVTSLGKQNMLLGMSWLRDHNPEIDWSTGEVRMTRCPLRTCSGCRKEKQEASRKARLEAAAISACRTGHHPSEMAEKIGRAHV